MALTGVRFQNTLDLVQNVQILPKSFLNCANSTCEFFSASCFDSITFLLTKTNSSHSCILLPYAKPCFFFLSSLVFNTQFNYDPIYSQFQSFLKANFSCTSHKIRKFLPNLLPRHLDSCNTGAWNKNSRTLENYYLSDNYKYFLAHNFILNLIE